jgi:hypothetical protein
MTFAALANGCGTAALCTTSSTSYSTPIRPSMKYARKLFLILVAITQSSCNSGARQDCAKHVKEKILPGSSVGAAEAELQKCGFKTTTDPVKKTLYGDKVVQGTPVSERTQVLIKLDSDDKVATVEVTTSLTGP